MGEGGVSEFYQIQILQNFAFYEQIWYFFGAIKKKLQNFV